MLHIGREKTYGKERADIDIEAQVSEGRGDDLGASVVAVLAHLGHENAGRATGLVRKLLQGGGGKSVQCVRRVSDVASR